VPLVSDAKFIDDVGTVAGGADMATAGEQFALF